MCQQAQAVSPDVPQLWTWPVGWWAVDWCWSQAGPELGDVAVI